MTETTDRRRDAADRTWERKEALKSQSIGELQLHYLDLLELADKVHKVKQGMWSAVRTYDGASSTRCDSMLTSSLSEAVATAGNAQRLLHLAAEGIRYHLQLPGDPPITGRHPPLMDETEEGG